MQNLFAGVSEAAGVALKNFLGGTSVSDAPPPDSALQETQPDVRHETAKDGSVVGATPAAGTKRRGEDDDEEKKGNKRQRTATSGSNARHLTGDYYVPRTAKPIVVPSDSFQQQATTESTATGSGGGMAAGTGYGRKGFKPTNTLNQARHKATAQQHGQEAGWMSNGRLKSTQKRTSNVGAAQPSRAGDGFEDYELPPGHAVKRQKLDRAPVRATHGGTVDLTNDGRDNTSSRSVETNGAMDGKPFRSSRNSSLNQLSSPTQPFNDQEFGKVDEKVKIIRKKQPRKPRDGRPQFSPASSELAPSLSMQGQKMPSSMLDGPIPYGGGCVGREKDPIQVSTTTSAKGHTTAHRAEPTINLTEDWPPMKPNAKVNNVDLEEIKGVLKRNGRRGSTQRAQSRTASPAAFETSALRRHIDQDNGVKRKPDVHNKPSVHNDTHESHSLNSMFVRIENDSSNSRPSTGREHSPDQQQKAQIQLPARVSPISEDELAGPDTRASPRKAAEMSRRPAKEQQARSRPSPSPGRRPTKERQSDKAREAQKSATHTKAAKLSPPIEANNIVHIRGFYAASLRSTAKDLRLEYIPDEKLVLVHEGEKVAKVPGKDRAVSIGRGEVSKVHWVRKYAISSICLKGPSKDVSNGWIVIDFDRPEDVKWFYDILLELCDERFVNESLDETKFQRVRKTANEVIEQGAKLLRVQLTQQEQAQPGRPRFTQRSQRQERSAHHGHPTQSQDTRARSLRSQENDEEHIIYDHEPTDVMRRTSTRQRKREQISSRQNPTVSSYFPWAANSFGGHPSHDLPPLPPIPPKWTQVNKPKPWSSSIIYPSQGAKRSTVDFEDLEKLDEDEFLNDNVVGFAIRHIEENMPVEHKKDVFFFNTFFYSSLTSLNGRKGFNYGAVKRWTKNVDLMSTPYVVVPINLNLHWFVAIICNLHNVQRKPDGLWDDEDEGGEARNEAGAGEDRLDAGIAGEVGAADRENLSQSTNAMEQLCLSDKNDSIHATPGSSAGKRKSKKKTPPAPRQYNPNAPVIITLDSFGNQHPAETRFLKDYITAEAEEKRGIQVDRDEIPGMTARGIPHQTNFSDCGLYMIGYVQEFTRDPKAFVTKVLTRQLDKESDFASFDPSEKRKEIRDTLLRLNEEREGGSKGQEKAPTHPEQASSNSVEPQQRQVDPKASKENEKVNGGQRAKTETIPPKSEPEQVPEAKPLSGQGDDDELETAVPIALGQKVEESHPRRMHPPNRIQEDDDEMLDITMAADKEAGESPSSNGDLQKSVTSAFSKHLPAATTRSRASRSKFNMHPDLVPLESSSEVQQGEGMSLNAPAGRKRRVMEYVNVSQEAPVEIPDSQEKM